MDAKAEDVTERVVARGDSIKYIILSPFELSGIAGVRWFHRYAYGLNQAVPYRDGDCRPA